MSGRSGGNSTRRAQRVLVLGVALFVIAGALFAAWSWHHHAGRSIGRSAAKRPGQELLHTSGSATTSTTPRPLAGKVVGIDPGHNGGNFEDSSYIDQTIWNGRENETCDTTGTETDGGYTEAHYNFNVAEDLKADLTAEGATVVMTRDSDTGVGPCVDKRAEILNTSNPVVAIDIHADGGPADGRGFAILEPVADGQNDANIVPSLQFGRILQRQFLTTGMPISTYDGVNGFALRPDLAGLNLATEPKVLIECGNMRNATDASMLVSPTFQAKAAAAIATAITDFVKN